MHADASYVRIDQRAPATLPSPPSTNTPPAPLTLHTFSLAPHPVAPPPSSHSPAAQALRPLARAVVQLSSPPYRMAPRIPDLTGNVCRERDDGREGGTREGVSEGGGEGGVGVEMDLVVGEEEVLLMLVLLHEFALLRWVWCVCARARARACVRECVRAWPILDVFAHTPQSRTHGETERPEYVIPTLNSNNWNT